MENIEVPEYFICPISLQIMKDPITIVTGITYDRDSIERWLSKNPNNNAICPVTKLHVPRDSDLTPNHTLRRLIQAWCVSNGFNVVDRVLTPKPPLSKFYVLNLVLDLSVPKMENIKTLEKLEMLAKENERNKTYMVEVGVHETLVNFLIQCYKKCNTNGLEKALSTLCLIWDFSSCHENKVKNREEMLIDSITWALGLDHDMQNHAMIKNHAMNVLRFIIGKANTSTLDRLKPQLFEKIIRFLRESDSNTTTITQKGVNAALQVMVDTSPSGKNRNLMIQSRAILELIELELNFSSNKKNKELIFGILFNLCSCADGRAQLLSHAAGIALITKRILKVSPIVDEKAILILCLISKYSATSGILQEMLKVESVSKICTVIQADFPSHIKDKAREILRSHFDVWKNSPCVEVATLTRYA
ncbi:E3 ubiquitin-protein ligase PUB24-like [Solanum dulcamara]|uniref:E3 ubiquitin-protein ligase PUB24-like n=1 Tax=Solanum dulcamara TaxID=45834 RepID=UPI002485520C|nr:E3 ubiquitin-protein ligase PUB24-like [Solanum dulcamara]